MGYYNIVMDMRDLVGIILCKPWELWGVIADLTYKICLNIIEHVFSSKLVIVINQNIIVKADFVVMVGLQ